MLPDSRHLYWETIIFTFWPAAFKRKVKNQDFKFETNSQDGEWTCGILYKSYVPGFYKEEQGHPLYSPTVINFIDGINELFYRF